MPRTSWFTADAIPGVGPADLEWLNGRVDEILQMTGIGPEHPRYETAVRSALAEAMDEFTEED